MLLRSKHAGWLMRRRYCRICFATRWLGARSAECVYRRHVGLSALTASWCVYRRHVRLVAVTASWCVYRRHGRLGTAEQLDAIAVQLRSYCLVWLWLILLIFRRLALLAGRCWGPAWAKWTIRCWFKVCLWLIIYPEGSLKILGCCYHVITKWTVDTYVIVMSLSKSTQAGYLCAPSMPSIW